MDNTLTKFEMSRLNRLKDKKRVAESVQIKSEEWTYMLIC